MSRIIVKNLPKYLTEDKFREHFAAKGEVTDAKLMKTANGTSRRFGFIGYRTEKAAEAAIEYFNNTFIDMSKITVEKAIPYGSESLPRPWSKYSAGSSAYERKNNTEKKKPEFQVEETEAFRQRQQQKEQHIQQLHKDENDPKLREFLDVMGARSTKGKTWANDDTAVLKAYEENNTQTKVKVSTTGVANRKAGGQGQVLTKTHVTFADSDDELYEDLPAKKKDDDLKDDDEEEDEDEEGNEVEEEEEDKEMEDKEEENEKQDRGEEDEQEGKEASDNESGSDEKQEDQDVEMQEALSPKEQIMETGRLFVRNLPYTCTEDELKEVFSKYGPLSEVHMPISKDTKRPKGFAYILYLLPEHAVKAFEDLDMKFFQGRLLHIIPGKEKPQRQEEQELYGPNGTKLSKVQKQKALKQKSLAKSDFNWNSLYMSSDAIAESIADRLGVAKSEILNAESDNMAVRLALAETQIVNETKEFLEKHGIILESFAKKERSDTVILVKNTPYGTSEDDMRELFGKYGELGRVLVPPAKTMAVVEFLEPSEARAAFKALAYRRYKDTLLYLEQAPSGLFKEKFDPSQMQQKKTEAKVALSGQDLVESSEVNEEEVDTATLFVKNLNFATTPEKLRKAFANIEGYRSSRINVKPNPKEPGKMLSMGFGFIEFNSKENAAKALKAMQGHVLDGHALQLKFSHSEKNKKKETTTKVPETTKLVVRNIPFEATAKELRELFGAYGKLKSLRLPKKFTGGHRGFAFLDFMTKQEAKNVYENMSSIHLYGRHLVLEWAQDDDDVETLRQKTGKSYAKEEELRKNKRRKVDLDNNNDDDDMSE